MTKTANFEPSQPESLLKYRCYLLDRTGRFADTKIFNARDDKEAAAYARSQFVRASSVYERFEVWNNEVLVQAHCRDDTNADESRQSSTGNTTESEVLGYVWRVDEHVGQAEQSFPTLSSTAFVARKSWIVTVRSLAIGFALTLGWILMFDPEVLKKHPESTSTLSLSAQNSQFRD